MDYLLSCIKFNFGGYGFIKNYQDIDLITVFPSWFAWIFIFSIKLTFLILLQINMFYYFNTCRNNLKKEWRDRRAIISKKHYESSECPICMDKYKYPLRINCGHIFCYDCLLILLEENERKVQCPMCRSKIKTIEKTGDSFPNNLDLMKLKEQLIKRNAQFDYKRPTRAVITVLIGYGSILIHNYIIQKISLPTE